MIRAARYGYDWRGGLRRLPFFSAALGCVLTAQAAELKAPPTPPRGLEVAAESPVPQKIQSKTIYVVQMRQPPAVRFNGGNGYAATAPADGEHYDAHSLDAQAYAASLVDKHDEALAAIGAHDRKIYSYAHTFNGFAARLTDEEATMLEGHRDVFSVFRDFAWEIDTNNSVSFLGLDDRREGLQRRLGLEGEDVIVGILDTGAIQEHPSFADTITVCGDDDDDKGEGKGKGKGKGKDDDDVGSGECRERLVYDAPPARWTGICQSGEGWAADDCNNKLIGARWFGEGFLGAGGPGVVPGEFISPRDSSGHGSHVASTAAGNVVTASLGGTPLAEVSGMAPRARIAVYKTCWRAPSSANFSCFFSDSAAATEAAVTDGVDVINFSVGTAASFTDPQDLAFLDATSAGVFIARSAGNSGPGFATTNAGEPWVMSVGASTLDGEGFALAVNISSPGSVAGDYPALEGAITQPLAESGPINGDLAPADPILACAPLSNDLRGRVALIARGVCPFTTKVENAVNAGATAVLMYSDDRPKVVMAGTATAITQSVPGVMIDNEPGLALLAALDAGNTVASTLSAGNFIEETLVGDIMADFSSRGPFSTETDWVKPDITAPGVRILAASTPEPADGSVGDLFAYLQGTSMSSPHIAGLAALVIEAHPDWTPAQVKSALMTSARQDVTKEDGVTPADPFDFGAGHVDPNKAVKPGLTYDAGQLDYLAATCGTVSPLLNAADCDFVESVLGLATDPADLNLPSIGIGELPGTQTVTRTVTAVDIYRPRDDDDDDDDDDEGSNRPIRYAARIEAPPGYEVSVSPDRLRLRPGETASYDITISNESAPPNEWRFGAITWEAVNGGGKALRGSGANRVRSPIAVNAVAFVTEDEIDSFGPSNMEQFDVTFGYTGEYTAGVHGLNDAELTLATVADDPTDSFEFLGPGVEIAFLAEVPAETALARWATYNEYTTGANDDIDLYLYYCPNFSCTLIDSSANADSNEEVSIEFPVNDPAITDPYLVFAHAFNTTDGAPTDLVLFDWAVGIVDDAGNMTVEAPASAVIGETETLTVNWEGLIEGIFAKQLGAISHSDASGVKKLTVIDVANDEGFSICDLGFSCR